MALHSDASPDINGLMCSSVYHDHKEQQVTHSGAHLCFYNITTSTIIIHILLVQPGVGTICSAVMAVTSRKVASCRVSWVWQTWVTLVTSTG